MVKCSNCGVDVADSFELCPNCGNNLHNVVGNENLDSSDFSCYKCNSKLKEGVSFCEVCGDQIKYPKAEQFCQNCGFKLTMDDEFCPECGTNSRTGEKYNNSTSVNNKSFIERINIYSIIKQSIVALILSVILSIIGLIIGFSWYSFIIAILISVGFFAGTIDTDANAVIFGIIIAIFLSILENPLVEFVWGVFISRIYGGVYGSHWLVFIIVSVAVAYLSNIFLKNSIQSFIGQLGIDWL